MKKKIAIILGLISVPALIGAGIYSGKLPAPDFYWSRPTPSTIGETTRFEELLSGWVYQQSNKISRQTSREIAREAIKTGMPLFILGLIDAESEFVPTAVSNKGAIGLTQVRFEVHGKELIRVGLIKDKRDLFDIGPSIHSGHYIFNMYLKQSGGNVEKAMELYLGGKDGAYTRKISLTLTKLYVLGLVEGKENQINVLPLQKGI